MWAQQLHYVHIIWLLFYLFNSKQKIKQFWDKICMLQFWTNILTQSECFFLNTWCIQTFTLFCWFALQFIENEQNSLFMIGNNSYMHNAIQYSVLLLFCMNESMCYDRINFHPTLYRIVLIVSIILYKLCCNCVYYCWKTVQ